MNLYTENPVRDSVGWLGLFLGLALRALLFLFMLFILVLSGCLGLCLIMS